ncbi:uro-adherence factor A [Euwallacea similis]|uniref:uro-adherence factor A n=1 Tax=Euwallacea similis TaxID=1736056 RepID=UPI0034508DBF
MQHSAARDSQSNESCGRSDGGRNDLYATKTLAHYSKKDILEQYCLSDKGFIALENGSYNIFGCLSSHNSSFCSNARTSIFMSCVGQKVPSEENLYELYKRNPGDMAPFPKKQRYPWAPLAPEMYMYDKDLKTSYFRKRHLGDPSRYIWMPPDDESVRMEKPKSISDLSYRNQIFPQCKKHVSFARSHTLTSFDDALMTLSSSLSQLNQISKSQERLLDVRKPGDLQTITRQPQYSENKIVLDKLKRGPMKTRATQTDAIPKSKTAHLNLSPNAAQKVKLVSQAAQTNGINGRRLYKSLSEVGWQFPPSFKISDSIFNSGHQTLQRTQSDEPPRSPFVTSASSAPMFLQDDQSVNESRSSSSIENRSDDSVETKNEIFIDYKPQLPHSYLKASNYTLYNNFADRPVADDEIHSDGHMLAMNDDIIKLTTGDGFHDYEEVFDDTDNLAQLKTLKQVSMPDIINQDLEKPITENFSATDKGPTLSTIDSVSIDESIVPSILLTLEPPSLDLFSDRIDGACQEPLPMVHTEPDDIPLGPTAKSRTVNVTDVTSSQTPATLMTPTSKRKRLVAMKQKNSITDYKILPEDYYDKPVESFSNSSPAKGKILHKPLESSSVIRNTNSTALKVRSKTTTIHFQDNLVDSQRHLDFESIQQAVVPDLHPIPDICRINADLSESTTTDDYITANSGTDSSRKSTNIQVVPSVSESPSPDPHFIDSNLLICNNHDNAVPQVRTTSYSSQSDDSSSSGSYSIGGSTADLLERLAKREVNKSRKDLEKSCVHQTQKKEKNVNSGSEGNVKTKRKKAELKLIAYPECIKVTSEKSQRHKERRGSPTRGQKKKIQGGKPTRSKEKQSNADIKGYKLTSDESSTGRENITNETTVRKVKKSKDNVRRRSVSRSPKSQKCNNKRPEREYQSSSLPNSLSRRKSPKISSPPSPSLGCKNLKPRDQETGGGSSTQSSKDKTTLKALSVESLRSISPGSDSVFYSDPSCYTIEPQVQCLQCGKEVHMHSHGEEKEVNGHITQPDIVKPPAGFEDSPKIKVGRFIKKSDGAHKGEDKSEKRRRHKPETRAKSEERSGGAGTVRGRLRPMQRSPYCSKENLKSADSSPCILPGAPEEENDEGLYMGSYSTGKWLCVSDSEKAYTITAASDSECQRRDSISSTESEHEFLKRYYSVRQKVTHRKPYVDMYKRLYSKSFDCDKTIVVRRESGEFGFRIHGSKPAVVTAIETGTPAESSGLQIGDIIIEVNGINVMDKSHSEVVHIAQGQNDILTLEIGRTCSAGNQGNVNSDYCTLLSGFLWKLKTHHVGNSRYKWTRRWFCLKNDNCLYYYKTESDHHPVGVFMLRDNEIEEVSYESKQYKSNSFVIYDKNGFEQLYLASDTLEQKIKWVDHIKKTIKDFQTGDGYLEDVKHNLATSPSDVNNPECLGYLFKLGTQWKSRSRRYCVLKDAALLFYQEYNSPVAFGVVLLHGYKVQQSLSSKKHGFEIIAQVPSNKHYYFLAESDADRKRWIAALEYSIDRWFPHT